MLCPLPVWQPGEEDGEWPRHTAAWHKSAEPFIAEHLSATAGSFRLRGEDLSCKRCLTLRCCPMATAVHVPRVACWVIFVHRENLCRFRNRITYITLISKPVKLPRMITDANYKKNVYMFT